LAVAEDDQEADRYDRTRAEQRHDQAEGTPHLVRIGRYAFGLNSYNGFLLATPEDALLPALLALHKAVLAADRENLERVHGSLSSSAFLQIVSDPVRYGWLKPFSALILAFEEDDEERAPAEELRDRARDLLLPPSQKTPFGRRYLSLMQREPGLVLAHAELAKLLR
jgi:hypothetical protein